MVDRDGFTPADIVLSMMKNGQKMGPMELADFTGVDVTSFCQDYYHEHLSPEYELSNAQRSFLQSTSSARRPVRATTHGRKKVAP
ncbi:MAG: 3-hydroxyacyl-CoA dehydrogenase family protein [Clostridiales bacterium]|nr:3-hydroxyacyl-CoA dehydrogenase family protein [Clostridiales bacterium]